MLLHLPDGYTPNRSADALRREIRPCPSPAPVADLGPRQEMRDWKQVTIAADIAIYFCDPH